MENSLSINTLTPMLRQYYEIKEKCPDAILFFRMGDFFEIFDKDAEEVAPILDIVLTSRERGDKNKIPFCGVPHHSAKNYWLKLLSLGYKVALADQIEPADEAKGLVARDIVRILTPGSIDELDGLQDYEPNYLLALYEEPKTKVILALLADISTGELRLGGLKNEAELLEIVEVFQPKEILVRGFYLENLKNLLKPLLLDNRILFSQMPENPLRDEHEQRGLLQETLHDEDLRDQPLQEIPPGGKPLLAATLKYLKDLKINLRQFLSVRPLFESGAMILDSTAIRDLELFETIRRRDKEGSLFQEINYTLSPMGGRFLRYSICHPLVKKEAIETRHNMVETLLSLEEDGLKNIRDTLKNTPDLERITARIMSLSVRPTELNLAKHTLQKVQNLLSLIKGKFKGQKLSHLLEKLATCHEPLRLLEKALREDSLLQLGLGDGFFKQGYDEELDLKTELFQKGENKVAQYEQRLRETTGINSLKVRNHKTFGLQIEVTKSNLNKVPADFIRKQTMVNGERFVTIELRELGDALSTATEEAIGREGVLFQELVQKLAEKFSDNFREISESFAILDVLQSFAWLALRGNYCKPMLSEGGKLDLRASRHPVVERFVGQHEFVSNDIIITPERRHLLVTGPNMAGKSTIMRQVALSAILNQAGCYVPARRAELPIFDRIFTRIGASDDLSRGKSTFMVEMSEAAQILRQATPKSLVILDEIGRGTSTQDGLAIAASILEELSQRLHCYSLFATHYHELVPLAESFQDVDIVKTEVLEKEHHVVFTHRLVKGASGSSYGIEVAKIAGLPEKVLRRADEYLALLKKQGLESNLNIPRKLRAEKQEAPSLPLENLVLSASKNISKSPQVTDLDIPSNELKQLRAIADRLNEIKIHRTTPLQALNILNDLKASLYGPIQKELFEDQPIEKR